MADDGVSIERLSQSHITAWQVGQPQSLESMLKLVDASQRSRALRALLLVELRFLRELGKSPTIATFLRRFPNDLATVQEVFDLISASPAPARSRRTRSGSSKRGDTSKRVRRKPKRRETYEAVKGDGESDGFEGLLELDEPVSPARPARKSKNAKASASDDGFEDLNDIEIKTAKSRRRKSKNRESEVSSPKEKKKRRSKDVTPATEFAIPLVLVLLGWVLTVALAMVQAPAEFHGMWVGIKIGYALFSIVVTTIALFVASAWFEIEYGYFGPAVLKVAAICLTQVWLDMAIEFIPDKIGGYVGAIVVSVATLALFMSLFQMGVAEAFRSMMVIRIVHRVGLVFLFGAFITTVMSGALNGPSRDDMQDADQSMQIDSSDMDDEDLEGSLEGISPKKAPVQP